VGTGALVSLLREMGNSLLGSVTLQAFISDPLDKVIVLLLVWAAVKSLPNKTLASLQPEANHSHAHA
jgi:energy-coupling factor transport system substrate-specific component